MGRDQILDAAISLFEHADLADVLSFLGTRAVAEAADVQPATVHHHFGNRHGTSKPNARLAAAVIEACVCRATSLNTSIEIDRLTASGSADDSDIPALRAVATANVQAIVEDRRDVVATLVAAAVAANDPVARDVLKQAYDEVLERYREAMFGLAEYLGRRFDSRNGFTPETFAVLGTALADGVALRHQFDPGRIEPELVGELALRLFEVATVPADDDIPVADAMTERLLGRDTLRLPADSGLDPAKRNRIVEAVREAYAEHGVEGISVTAVAKAAGVSRGTVIANFGDRAGLAAAVWAQHVPDLERRLQADRDRQMPLARLVERHLHRVVDLCKAAPQLTALLLEGMISQTIRKGAPTYDEPDDPRAAVPIAALLVPVLSDSPHLRPELARTPAEAKDLAATITYLTMVRSASRPRETDSETAHYIMDLIFDGILARNEGE